MTNATLLTSPSSNLTASKKYYTTLDFNVIEKKNKCYAIGKEVVIELNQTLYARKGLRLIRPEATLKDMLNNLPSIKIEDDHLIVSPEGCCIYVNSAPLLLAKKDFRTECSLLGNFQGISIECANIETSLEFWLKIGFKQVAGNAEAGWIALKNEDNFDLSLMRYGICPHQFTNPGLNFFNGKANPIIIEEIKKRGLNIQQEITHFNPGEPAENIIMADPSGLFSFVFND